MSQSASRARIRTLSGVLANQIAAGEVVERPASVVKELVENALDAQATRIDVHLESGGGRLIRVRDDGFGIPAGELGLALSRHATSKIASLDDLDRIASMGFRGEALPSIASVSRLLLESRPRDAQGGARVCVDGGVAAAVEPAASAFGTTVEVRDLFFNVPARRKFLRTPRTELRHAEDAVRRLALARTEVSFTLHHDARSVMATTGRMEPTRRLSRLVGEGFASSALEISFEANRLSMHGFLAPPSAARSRPDLQFLFVNGRSVRDNLVRHAVRVGFGEMLGSAAYPAFVLHLEIDPAAVDVNVHPTKHEIRFREPRHVHDFVRHAVSRALGESSPDAPPPDAVLAVGSRTPPPEAGESPSGTAALAPYRARGAGSGDGRIAEHAAAYRALSPTPHPPRVPTGRRTVRLGAWVLVEDREHLVLIDLSTARGALVRERLDASVRVHDPVSRPLLIPHTRPVTEVVAEAVDESSDSLRSLGIEVRRGAPGALTLRGIPACLAGVAPDTLLDAVAGWAKASGAMTDLLDVLAGVAESCPFEGDVVDVVDAVLAGRLGAAAVSVDETRLRQLAVAARR